MVAAFSADIVRRSINQALREYAERGVYPYRAKPNHPPAAGSVSAGGLVFALIR